MSRTERLTPEQLSEPQRALYQAIASGPRSSGPQLFELTGADGALNGPFNAMLLSPGLGTALSDLGAAIRYASALTPRTRELAILAVAARWSSDFERYAHERVGRAVGVTDDELAAIAADEPLDLADPAEAAAHEAVRDLLDGDLDDEGYRRVVDAIGEAALFELSTLVGYYATLALQLRVFRVTTP